MIKMLRQQFARDINADVSSYEPLIEVKHPKPGSAVRFTLFSVRILQADVNCNVVSYPAR